MENVLCSYFLSFILCVADLGFIGLYVTLHAQYINTMLIIGHFLHLLSSVKIKYLILHAHFNYFHIWMAFLSPYTHLKLFLNTLTANLKNVHIVHYNVVMPEFPFYHLKWHFSVLFISLRETANVDHLYKYIASYWEHYYYCCVWFCIQHVQVRACMSFRGVLDWTFSKIGARYDSVGARFGSVLFWHKLRELVEHLRPDSSF